MRQREADAARKRIAEQMENGMSLLDILRGFNSRHYLGRQWKYQEIEDLAGDEAESFDMRQGDLTTSGDIVPAHHTELEQVRDELVRFKDNPSLANRMALTLIDHYLGNEASK